MDPAKTRKGNTPTGNANPWMQGLNVALVLTAWLGVGTGLMFTNRILMTGGLHAPVSLTLLHMISSFLFSTCAVKFGGLQEETIGSHDQARNIAILASAFGVSVVSGVGSLRFIPISFVEMISSTTPLFTAMFAAVLTRETGGGVLSYLALSAIAGGAMLASNGEPMWNLTGVTLAVSATVLRALKAVLQQVLLQHQEQRLSSINLLRYMSMFVIFMLIPAALVFEGPNLLINSVQVASSSGNNSFMLCLFLNVTTAFLTNWVQMQAIKVLGATALQVIGIFKGCAIAMLSVWMFRNPVTVSGIIGYTIVTCGVVAYNILKLQAAKNEAPSSKQPTSPRQEEQTPKSAEAPLLASPTNTGSSVDSTPSPAIGSMRRFAA